MSDRFYTVRTDDQVRYFCSVDIASSRCTPERRRANRIAQPINPAKYTVTRTYKKNLKSLAEFWVGTGEFLAQ